MARYVKVGTLGLKPMEFPQETSYADMVKGVWEHLSAWIDKVLYDEPDFIVLNECCDRPAGLSRTQQRDYYKARGNAILEKMQEKARQNSVNIAYSAVLHAEDGALRNSTVFIGREGEVRGVYNKNHLVIEENTESGILYGKDAPIIKMDFGTVAGVICFDLNFPELLEKYQKSRPELLVFCSMFHGGHVQQHWAYSCRSYFVGAVGVQGLPCNIWNPLGYEEAKSSTYLPFITHTINLDYAVAHIDYNAEKFEHLKKKYGKGVTIYDPGYLGSVLITSELDGISAMDMIKEFEIELLDDYIERARAARYTEGRMEK